MHGFVETKATPKKEWVAPELKKVDIEQITAIGGGKTKDGTGGAKS